MRGLVEREVKFNVKRLRAVVTSVRLPGTDDTLTFSQVVSSSAVNSLATSEGATTSCCSYLIVALVLAEMLLQLAVSGKDLRTYSAFLLPIAESIHFAITGICTESKRERVRFQRPLPEENRLQADVENLSERFFFFFFFSHTCYMEFYCCFLIV